MAKKESHLSGPELDSLRIDRLIFHVYNAKATPPLTLLDHELDLPTGSQREYFEGRLKAAASGTQFVFTGYDQATKALCAQLIAKPREFVKTSKALVESFSKHHRGRQMAAGVIIVALSTVVVKGDELPLVFILKVDHRPVISYRIRKVSSDVKARMRDIANALVEDKAAVQRSALIDVSETYAWDVLAAERNEGAAPELKIFFKAFLGVEPREDASLLTRRAVSSVTEWARTVPLADRPEGQVWQRYKERATQYMKDHQDFDADAFIDTVVSDEDPVRKAKVEHGLREVLREKGIEGQKFKPMPQSLPSEVRRTRLVTEEGVQIIYEGDQSTHRVQIENDPENGPGAKMVIIRTTNLVEKNQ